jgi:hypothetical protein
VAIGDTYGGGIIFYILQVGDTGYDAAVQHGLIAATSDQSDDATWAITSVITGATGDAIGAGKLNTQKIIDSNGGDSYTDQPYAAKICADYRGGDYSDWYLPSSFEIKLLSLHTDIVSGLTHTETDTIFFRLRTVYHVYWSSTEIDADNAYYEYFHGEQTTFKSDTGLRVRAIRSF